VRNPRRRPAEIVPFDRISALAPASLQ